MLVAITGGSGFIGRHLVDAHLKRGNRVRLLSRTPGRDSGVEWVQGDLTNPNVDLEPLIDGVDVLYHCAAELSNEAAMHVLHVEGTRRLVDAAKGRIGRWVQLSSVGAYGRCRDGVVSEQAPEDPENTYEITKTKSDEIVRQSDIPYVILRPSIVFSEAMTNQSLLQLLGMIRKGLFFYIGRPGAKVNYVHVDDVIDAMCLCATDLRAIGQVFNLSQTTTLEKMVESLAAGCGIKAKPYRLPMIPAYAIVVLFGWINGFPLTRTRLEALTSRCSYVSDKITQVIDFEFKDSLDNRFREFVINVVR